MEGNFHGSKTGKTTPAPQGSLAPAQDISDLCFITQKARPPCSRGTGGEEFILRDHFLMLSVWPQKEPVKCRNVKQGCLGESVVLLCVLCAQLWGHRTPGGEGSYGGHSGDGWLCCPCPLPRMRGTSWPLLLCLVGDAGSPRHPQAERDNLGWPQLPWCILNTLPNSVHFAFDGEVAFWVFLSRDADLMDCDFSPDLLFKKKRKEKKRQH